MGWPWLGLALALVLGVAVAVLGIWAGAWRAATAPLVSRPTKSADFRWSVVRLVLGALVLAGGITAVVLGLGPTAPLMLGLGLVGALVGMYLVCPVIIVALGYLFGALTGLVAGIGTRLARLDLRRRPARAGNVAGVFVITLALATTALILSGSARDGLRTTLEQDVKADFVVTADVADQALSDSAVSEIRQVPDTHVLSLGLAPARLVLPDQTDPVEARVMYGPAELFSFVDTPVLEGNMTGLATGAAVTRDFAEAHGLALGDELAFVVSQGTPFEEQSTLPVGLIIDSWLYRDVLVPSSWLTPLVPGPARSQLMPATLVLASATNPANQVQLGGAIEAVADAYHRMQVQSGADFAAQSQPAADVIQLAGYVLVAVGVLVTGLAMALALGRSVAERREMIGLLKALGASRGQVQAGVVIESILVSAGGALLGIGLGIAVAWLVPAGVVGLPLAGLTLPWLWLVGLLVAAIVVGLVAPLSAAHQAARTPTLGLAA
jgi:putative ABC transport system permease protein